MKTAPIEGFIWRLEDLHFIPRRTTDLPVHLGGSRQAKLSADDPVHLFPQEKPKYPSLQEAVGRSWSATEAAFGKLKVRWFEVAGLKGTKFNPNHDEHGRFSSGSGGGHSIRVRGNKEEVQNLANEIMGRAVDLHEIGGLTGVGDGVRVDIEKGIRGDLILSSFTGDFELTRTLVKGDDGRPQLINNGFEVSTKGSGLGTEIFAREARNASKAGVSRITTTAARSVNGSLNGYYTWARLGYDGEIPSSKRNDFRGTVIEGAKTVHEVMRTPGGSEVWKEKGSTFEGTFDLTPGSTSMRILESYAKQKGIEWKKANLSAQKMTRSSTKSGPISTEDAAALDSAIADFLREFAGADRSAEEFSSQESEDGILQQSLYLAHSVGIERAQNVTGTDLNATFSAAQREALAADSFARLSEDGRLRFETRLDEIRQSMMDAFSRGDNPLDIAKQLGIGLTGYEQGRLRTIIRTEMGLASEAAIRTGYQQAGISRVEVIGDPNTDELCTVHIGKSYGLSELDSLPIYHPNCFCSTIPAADGKGMKGHRPDQPRVPAGSPEGGEFTSGGGGRAEESLNAMPTLRQPVPPSRNGSTEGVENIIPRTDSYDPFATGGHITSQKEQDLLKQ